MRHVSRWTQTGRRHATGVAKLAISLLAALRGSICLYQGEELACRRPNSPSRICAIPTASASGRPSRAATAAARRWSGKRQAPTCRLFAAQAMAAGARDASRAGRRPTATHQASVLAALSAGAGFPPRHPALVGGAIEFLAAKGDVLAFIRSDGDERPLSCSTSRPSRRNGRFRARLANRRPWKGRAMARASRQDDCAGCAVVLFRADWMPVKRMRRKHAIRRQADERKFWSQ